MGLENTLMEVRNSAKKKIVNKTKNIMKFIQKNKKRKFSFMLSLKQNTMKLIHSLISGCSTKRELLLKE